MCGYQWQLIIDGMSYTAPLLVWCSINCSFVARLPRLFYKMKHYSMSVKYLLFLLPRYTLRIEYSDRSILNFFTYHTFENSKNTSVRRYGGPSVRRSSVCQSVSSSIRRFVSPSVDRSVGLDFNNPPTRKYLQRFWFWFELFVYIIHYFSMLLIY